MQKKILAEQLEVGMYVSHIVHRDDHRLPRKSRRMMLDRFDVLKIKNSKPAYLIIDTRVGRDIQNASAEEENYISRREIVASSLASEIKLAQLVIANAMRVVSSIFSDAPVKMNTEMGAVNSLLQDIDDSLMRHPHALICLVRMKKSDDCIYLHSVAVCCLMIALSKKMGHSASDSLQAGLAGLTHDIGKTAVSKDILCKPGSLTAEEFESIKKHTSKGVRILASTGVMNRSMLEVCMHHHERLDGSGYPHGLVDGQISLLSKMAAICDVYDAMTSHRSYKNAWCPARSIREMANWRGHFDPKIFLAFVRVVGVYPNGTLVKLSSNKLALVLDQNGNDLLHPKVVILMCTVSRSSLPNTVIDTSQKKSPEKIVGTEDAKRWGFNDLNSLWSELVERHSHP